MPGIKHSSCQLIGWFSRGKLNEVDTHLLFDFRMETSMLAMTIANAQHGETVDISGLMKESNKRKTRRYQFVFVDDQCTCLSFES